MDSSFIFGVHNLILPHGDVDHMGKAINIVSNLKVDKVIFNCGNYNNFENNLIKILNNKKIKSELTDNEINKKLKDLLKGDD